MKVIYYLWTSYWKSTSGTGGCLPVNTLSIWVTYQFGTSSEGHMKGLRTLLFAGLIVVF